jgi:hypothetical protein
VLTEAAGMQYLKIPRSAFFCSDFPPPKDTDQHNDHGRPIPEPVSDTDARLAYVAVTRARHHLDLGGLS